MKLKPLPLPLLLVPALAAAVYLAGLPTTIQIGDSAEFLLAGKFGLVAHPPGYPLYVHFLHLLSTIAPAGEYIRLVSLATALFGVGSLAALAWAGRGSLASALVPSACLAFSFAFWRFSLLPDVFALHLFLASLYLVFFHRENFKYRGLLLSFLFGLGCSHHPTFIFLAPFQIFAFLHGNQKGKMILVTALTFILSAGSLLLLHDGPLAWGSVTDWGGAISHFLRADYGSFRLSAAGEGSFYFAILGAFVKSLAEFLPALGLLFWGIYRRDKEGSLKKLWPYLASLALILFVFFPLMNIAPTGYGQEVVERFFLLPQLLLCWMAARVWGRVGPLNQKRDLGLSHLLLVGLLVGPLLSLFAHWPANNFSRNFLVKEFAQNMLGQAETDRGNSGGIILAGADSSYFSLKFTLALEPEKYPGVRVLSPKLLFLRWYQLKAAQSTGLDLSRLTLAPVEGSFFLDRDLLRPNAEKFRFYFDRGDYGHYRLTALPAAVRLEEGQGFFPGESDFKPTISSKPENFRRASGFDSYESMFSIYANYGLAKAAQLVKEKRPQEAIAEYRLITERFPNLVDGWVGICAITKSPACKKE